MKLGSNDISSVKIGSTDVNKIYIGSTEVWTSNSGLLADYPGAAAAYSLRLLQTTYTGDSIRVRRASDNAESDIGFVSGQLDTSTLETFCSGTDGFVTTWYDQSGNGYDMNQSTAANQPQIVNSGSTITEGIKPTIYFDGVDDLLLNNDTISAASDYWVFYARNLRSANNGFVFDSQIGRLVLERTGSNSYFDQINFYQGGAISSGNHLIHLQLVYPTSGAVYEDSVNTQSGLNYNQMAISTINAIGGRYIYGLHSKINLQEFILYPSDQSSNRTGIETNINTHYNIY